LQLAFLAMQFQWHLLVTYRVLPTLKYPAWSSFFTPVAVL